MKNVRIGMAKGGLEGTHQPKWPVHDPLEAVAVFLADEGQPAVFIQLDFCYLSVGAAKKVRDFISEGCGLPADRFILHSTHNHTGPEEREVDLEGLAKRLIPLVQSAKGRAQPATVAYAEVDTGRKFNINRRKPIPGIGTFTQWLGYRNHQGEPDGGPILRARLSHWLGKPVTDPKLLGPILYNGPTDGLIQAVFFKNEKNQPIGSLFRYSAHPCIAGHTTQKHFSADYPGVVKKRMEAAFGGMGVFLSGPCGNLAPWEQGDWPEPGFPTDRIDLTVPWLPHKDPKASFKEIERIGNALVDALLPHLPKDKDYLPCRKLNFIPHEISLPVREDLLEDPEEAKRQARPLREEFMRIRGNGDLRELKKLADRINFLEFHNCFYNDYYYLNKEQWQRRQITANMPTLQLNDLVLMGWPAEAFWETPQAAFSAAKGRHLKYISFTEANGDIGYIATEAQRDGGDYEPCCGILARGAEKMLSEEGRKLAERL
jgi:hypothetical protein